MPLEERIRLMDLQIGGILAQAVAAVAELGVPDHIEPGSVRHVSELAAATGCHERSLYRTLRFLSSHGIFEETADRAFALTPVAAELRSDGSFRAGARLFGYLAPANLEFVHCLKTGEPGFTKAVGKPVFEYLGEHPDQAAVFDTAMTAIHGPEGPAMLEAYDFSGVSTLADIGGGNGSLLASALEKYPEMKGIHFDLGHVSERAAATFEASGVAERCNMVSGSFFESFPEGADAYLMRHIIHDWNDDQCTQILKNCRAVIPDDGRLLVVEPVIPPGNDPAVGKNMDMVMMLTPGGLERTEQEYRELYAAAGFELTGVTPTPSPVSVIQGKPI